MAQGSFERLDDGTALSPSQGAVVVVGNFDGVHRGHATVLATAVARARREGLASCVLTFDPHPRSVVQGQTEPPPLTTMERRVALMRRFGVERVLVRAFDAAFAAWSPRRFVEELLVRGLAAKVVMIGENFHFGSMAAGDFATMTALGEELGFTTVAHPLEGDAEGPFSSSRARAAVVAGDMGEAERILGRPHALAGVVVHGKKLGRTLGFPTANLDGVAEVLPPDGVYAVLVDELAGDGGGASALGFGALSIGVRPTVGDGLARTVEVYVLDPYRDCSDLYGRSLRLHVVSRIRGEARFSDLEALKRKMDEDVAETRRRLAGKSPTEGGAFG